jgi:hypothetical protein
MADLSDKRLGASSKPGLHRLSSSYVGLRQVEDTPAKIKVFRLPRGVTTARHQRSEYSSFR